MTSHSPVQAPSTPPIDFGDLKRKSLKGGALTLGAQGVNIVINLVSTMVLARLLSPQDYGILAMVTAVTSFAGLFGDLGLSTAAVQRKDLGQRQQSNLFWLNVAMGSMLTVTVASAAPLVAWFYKKPEVLWVTVALSANFLIASLGTQSGAMLIRQMRFGDKALSGILGALASVLVSITLAFNGFSYWSLVWGGLSGAICTTLFVFLRSPLRPGLPSRDTGIREMMKFGAHVTAFDFINYFQRNLDNILIGRYWGSEPLGFYSRAYSLLMFPINTIRGPINAVAFSALSRLQNEPVAFRDYYLKTTSLLATLSMPLAAFLFVASEPIIALVYGSQWAAVSPIFSYLALAAFIQPTAGFVGSLMLSLGQGRRYFKVGFVNAVVLSASFVIGISWGPKGVAMAYAIVNYMILYPWLSWVFRESPVSLSDFGKTCFPPVVISILSGAVAMICKPYLVGLNSFMQILILGLIFSMVSIPALLCTQMGKASARFLLERLSRLKEKFRNVFSFRKIGI